MWTPSAAVRESANPEALFVLALWQELFDPYTPDTYQPRLLHSLGLVEELLETAQLATRSSRWSRHVSSIRAELKVVLDGEEGLFLSRPRIAWELRQLANAEALSEVIDYSQVVLARRDAIVELVRDGLERSISALPRAKSQCAKHVRWLATHALRNGVAPSMSPEHLEPRVGLSGRDLVEFIWASANPGLTEYQCVVEARGNFGDVDSFTRGSAIGIAQLKELPDALAQREKSDDTLYLIGVQLARGRHEAAQKMMAAVRPMADIFNLYSNRIALSFGGDVWVRESGGSEWDSVSEDRSTSVLKPRRGARRFTRESIEHHWNGKLPESVANALEHHNLALSSSDPKVGFVNLWSALESLVGSADGEKVIDKVATCLPIVVSRRVDKIVRYLAISIHNARIVVEGRPSHVLPASDKDHCLPGDVLRAVTRPKNHPDIVGLLGLTASHPLLCQRVFTTWKDFHDPKALEQALRASFQRTTWHLERLYRVRNLIVHYGKRVRYIEPMLRNLHYYFSLTVSRVLESLGRSAGDPVRQVLSAGNLTYRYMLTSLAEHPSRLNEADFLVSGAGAGGGPLWAT